MPSPRKYPDLAHLSPSAYKREANRRKVAEWRKQNPSRATVLRDSDYWRKRRYGITPEQYAEMLAKQKGACAICISPMEKPHVDHCHQTGKVRGLLCSACNTSIGKFKHDPVLLQRAADYCK